MNKKRNITICVSWPYANNKLHIGYIASSLSGDILARYHRLVKDDVVLVSGTDSHGTKMEVKANAENVSPKDIVDRYHAHFVQTLKDYDFSFDKFSITYDEFHIKKSQEFFEKMYQNGYLYSKEINRPFCTSCNKFVADTEVEIVCPVCGRKTKGDNCDCGYVPVEEDFKNGKCLVCGHETEQRKNKILVFKLTAFKDLIERTLENGKNIWRANSINETKKYLDELCDRDFSRDLKWGVPITIEGFEDKTVWVWYEALLGYVTDTMLLGEEQGFDWRKFWIKDVEPETEKIIYACHAKDNIMFHSIIFPAELQATNEGFVTDIRMVSAEYLNFNGKKISKSNAQEGLSFDAKEWSDKYDSDSLRYYFTAYGPEKKDINFTFEGYQAIHNSDVVNKLGNLVNRTLKFKGLETLPSGTVDENIKLQTEKTYEEVADCIEHIEFKKAMEKIMELVMNTNKYYDEQKPWEQRKNDENGFANTMFTCAYVIANLSTLLEPVMPKMCAKIRKFLSLNNEMEWSPITLSGGENLMAVEPLFSRI